MPENEKKMRLIDANDLYNKFIDGESDTEQEKSANQLSRYLIRHAPTIDSETLPIVRRIREELKKAEKQRDAAIKELDEVSAAVDDLSDFIDEQIHPLVQYDIYTALRENADAISMWQYENEWRGQKEE